ncbi:MAG: hypothetical protein KGL44_00830 [Sphingomonadales bacterium]|nr:hypothetical protein [Sphingomonadales bacterium]
MTDNPTPAPAGFDFNRPTIISLLYLSQFFIGLTGIVGVVLAFVWRSEPMEDWERSHYTYLINTFWIGLAGSVIGVLLLFVLIGVLVLLATMVLVIVRSVLCLLNAQKRQPMPKPDSWLA